MGDLIAVCPEHGPFVVRNFISGTAPVQLQSVATSCPICHRRSLIPDGTYEFVDSVVTAFRAPGVTREAIQAFQTVTQAAKGGAITAAEAEEQAAALGSVFEAMIRWANSNPGGMAILGIVVAIFLGLYTVVDTDLGAARQLAESERQTSLLEKIYEAMPQYPAPLSQPVTSQNRKGRRAAAADARSGVRMKPKRQSR